MGFQKALREQVWTKTLIAGPSGAGKSYSALRMATGMAKALGSRIAYIGTEGSRDKYYANEFDYDLLQIEAPYKIDKYLDALDDAIESGYKVVIIDQISSEWQWLNDQHDKMPGNSFQNWGKLKPIHNKFMETILMSPIHVIACGRGKTEWVMEEENGKQKPKKVGLGIQSDKDIAYNYTLSLMLEQGTHIASTDKDNTHLWDGRFDVITEADGEALISWANNSDIPAPVVNVQREIVDEDTNGDLIDKMKTLFKAMDADQKSPIKDFMKDKGYKNFDALSELATKDVEEIFNTYFMQSA